MKTLLRSIFFVLYLLLFVTYFLSRTERPALCSAEGADASAVASAWNEEGVPGLFSVLLVWTISIVLDEILQLQRDGMHDYFR